jgi:hypothetical protein
VPYQVTVVTSDVRGAGTDADVMLTMVGDKGSAGPFKLDDSKNNLERGQTDTFTVKVGFWGWRGGGGHPYLEIAVLLNFT